MIILRQKSYSKFGRFVGDIEKKIQSRGDKIRSKIDEIKPIDTKERKSLLGKLYDEAKKSGVRKIKGSDYEFDPDTNSIITTKGGLKDNPIFVAHELGHSQRYKTRTGKRNIDASLKTPANWDFIEKKQKSGKTPSFLEAVKTSIKTIGERIPQLHEEAAANRRGYKLLKKSGASKETLDLAKKTYKLGYKSYKSSAKSQIISPFKNY